MKNKSIYILFSYFTEEKERGERINTFVDCYEDVNEAGAEASKRNKEEEETESSLRYFVSAKTIK